MQSSTSPALPTLCLAFYDDDGGSTADDFMGRASIPGLEFSSTPSTAYGSVSSLGTSYIQYFNSPYSSSYVIFSFQVYATLCNQGSEVVGSVSFGSMYLKGAAFVCFDLIELHLSLNSNPNTLPTHLVVPHLPQREVREDASRHDNLDLRRRMSRGILWDCGRRDGKHPVHVVRNGKVLFDHGSKLERAVPELSTWTIWRH